MKLGLDAFAKHFKYLGRYLHYSLREKYDIDACLVEGNALTGTLNKLFTDNSFSTRSTYIIFLDIPTNLLLWVCEIWEIRTSLLNKL